MDEQIEERLVRIEGLTTALRSALEEGQEREVESIAWSLSREARDLDSALEQARQSAELEAAGFGWIKKGARARVKSGKTVKVAHVFMDSRQASVYFEESYVRRTVRIDQLEPVEETR